MPFEGVKGGYGPVAPRHRRPPGKQVDPTSGGGHFLDDAQNPYREDPFDARYDAPAGPARPPAGSNAMAVLAWMRALKVKPTVYDYPAPGPEGAGIPGDMRSYTAHRPTADDPGRQQAVTPFRPEMFGEDGWTLNEQQYREQNEYNQNWQAPELWKPHARIDSTQDGQPASAVYAMPKSISDHVDASPSDPDYLSKAQDVYAYFRAARKNQTAGRLQQALQGRR